MNYEVSIIIPVYNEKSSLEKLVEKIISIPHPFSYEILLIDSGSNDGSSEVIMQLAKKFSLRFFRLEKNKGKGFAVRHGLKNSLGEMIIIQDADLEYEPADYSLLIDSIKNKNQHFVLGSRHLYVNDWRIRKSKKFNVSLEIINFGSQVLTWIFCKLYSVKISDSQTMYKVFKKEIIKDIHFTCDRFDFDFELLGKLVLKGYIPKEVPVQYNSRTAAEGKKLNFIKDGVQAVLVIFKVRIMHILKIA